MCLVFYFLCVPFLVRSCRCRRSHVTYTSFFHLVWVCSTAWRVLGDAALQAVRALGRALIDDVTSALLRHEVAYVLGQMQHPARAAVLSSVVAEKWRFGGRRG